MNTYKIIFTRENGTQGTDHFTAATERQARKDFGECYRHSTATIISIELASTNAPATKQQERDTLEKIQKMVEQLGPDSYLAAAFEGCFDLAAENISNDWACSMADRVRRAEKRAAELEDNAAVGEAFGYHPVYLAQLYREHTGTTLHRAILENKLELACRWLTHTDRSIEQIAFDTGFSSRSHFCTAFRRRMGMTPKAYRKK